MSQIRSSEQIALSEATYLAGYLERSGSLSIYTQQSTNEPFQSPTIVSAGIRVRLRDSDPAALNLVVQRFGGKVQRQGNVYHWTASNARAASLLETIQPFLRRGNRRILVSQLLAFHAFMGRKRRRAKLLQQPLSLSLDDLEEIAAYRQALRVLKGRPG